MEQIMPFIWIGFAVLMAVFEAATSQLVSIWFVIGSISAALTSIFTPSILIQSVVFVTVSMVALIVTRPIAKKLTARGKTVSTNADRLIGQTGTVLAEIADTESVGQVRVLGEIWSAKSNQAPIAEASKVRVLAIEGVKLIVEPFNEGGL